MALDDLSGGRFLCGVRAGAPGFDAGVLGHDLRSPAARIDRLTEFVELLDLLLTSDHVRYEGGCYTARDARTLPGCVRRPRVPLVVAGSGPGGQRLALRLGDGWITNGPGTGGRNTSGGPAWRGWPGRWMRASRQTGSAAWSRWTAARDTH
jgi:alkanesulfonate monooxygenase SsuD/methylene tetrahydromethanopterin reductase-like flavin-dependent oxidoreductase (luciferase family)